MRSYTRRSGYAVEHVLPERLLRAALLSDERAIQEWRAWQPLVNQDDLDEGSHRLLPLLHYNLTQLGVPPEELEKYKQVYRFYWYKNQFIVSKAAPIFKVLESSGIQYLLLKGAPMAFLYYPNPGLRPFADIDILVKPVDTLRALSLFKQHGFAIPQNYPEAKVLQIRHALNLKASNGLMIDLHWRLLPGTWNYYTSSALWEESISFQFGAHKAQTPNPSIHLFHTCLHGRYWSPVAPVRWAADAAILLRQHAQNIDWDWIIQQSEHHRLSVQLQRQLIYLHTRIELPIPSDAFRALTVANCWRWEKLESSIVAHPPNIFTKLLNLWFTHRRSHPTAPLWRVLVSFPQFLMDILNIQKKGILLTIVRKLRAWV